MNNLVIMHDQQAVTTSLILAEAFGKQHKHVLEAISSKINSAENSAQYKKMFAEATYTDKSGKQNKMYYLNRDGFTFIAMGFTGRKADEFKLKYIDAFNRMEGQIKQQPQYKLPQTFSEALIELAKEVKKNEELQPKADKYDRYLSYKGLITITEIAKEYGMSGRELNQFLHEKGIIFKKGSQWFVYQKYAELGLASYEIFMPGDREVRRSLKWTTKGEQFIRDLLEAEGIMPVLERPSQMTFQEAEVEYDGEYYTASNIAYYLGLGQEWILKIGEIANRLHIKPRFTDSNAYCRKTLDENGFIRWEYTMRGAAMIEQEINKIMALSEGATK